MESLRNLKGLVFFPKIIDVPDALVNSKEQNPKIKHQDIGIETNTCYICSDDFKGASLKCCSGLICNQCLKNLRNMDCPFCKSEMKNLSKDVLKSIKNNMDEDNSTKELLNEITFEITALDKNFTPNMEYNHDLEWYIEKLRKIKTNIEENIVSIENLEPGFNPENYEDKSLDFYERYLNNLLQEKFGRSRPSSPVRNIRSRPNSPAKNSPLRFSLNPSSPRSNKPNSPLRFNLNPSSPR